MELTERSLIRLCGWSIRRERYEILNKLPFTYKTRTSLYNNIVDIFLDNELADSYYFDRVYEYDQFKRIKQCLNLN